MDRVRRWRGDMMAELKLQRTRCGNGGAGDGGRARGAAADAGGDRYGSVQAGAIFKTTSWGHLIPSAEGSRSENEMSKVTYLNEGKVSKTFKRKRWKHKRTQ